MTETAQTTEPETTQPSDELATTGNGQASAELANIERALTGGDYVTIDDPAAIEQEIIAKVLSAESADDVLAVEDTVSLKDIVDQELRVNDVKWNRSKLDGRHPVYAVIDATRIADGERMVVTTSASRVMAQLLKLAQLGALPRDVIARQSGQPTEDGFYPLRLEAVRG